MFKAHANPKTNKLDRESLDKIFLPTDLGRCPWDVVSETVYENLNRAILDAEGKEKAGEGVTLESWVGLWIKYANVDIMTAFRDLVLIGYCGQMKDAIHLVKFKPKDVHGVPKSRKSFNCLVISPVPKLSARFIDAFIQSEANGNQGKGLPGLEEPEQGRMRTVVRTIKEKHPNDKDKFTLKYLILTEVDPVDVESGDLFQDADLI